MMRFTKIKLGLSGLLMIFSILSFCQGSNSIYDISNVKKKAIKNYVLTPGVHNEVFMMQNNKPWKVRVSIPKKKLDEKYPLVLALHWAGDQSVYKTFSDCLVFPALDTLNAIFVVPTSGHLHWIDSTNEKRVIDLIKKIKKFWPVDDQKIMVIGYSNGGIGSWIYADKYSNIFSVAVAMAGQYNTGKIKIPTYVIHGKSDELFNVSEVQKTMQESKALGSEIDFTVMDKFTHFMACAYKDILLEKVLHIKNNIFKDNH